MIDYSSSFQGFSRYGCIDFYLRTRKQSRPIMQIMYFDYPSYLKFSYLCCVSLSYGM